MNRTSPEISRILNELNAIAAVNSAIHAAKIAAGGRRRMPDVYIDEQWIGLPADFPATARQIVEDTCSRFGVTPQDIGRAVR